MPGNFRPKSLGLVDPVAGSQRFQKMKQYLKPLNYTNLSGDGATSGFYLEGQNVVLKSIGFSRLSDTKNFVAGAPTDSHEVIK